MFLQPWHLVALEEMGYTDTSDGLVNRVAKYLANSPNDTISGDEFRKACTSCGVDPNSFSSSDLEMLQKKLDQF